MEYEQVSFCNDQFDEYNHFLDRLSLGRDSQLLPDRHWWELSDKVRSYIFIAHDGKEVAARCYITERVLSHQGISIPCFEIGGTVTMPSHRRRGLYSKLVKKAVQTAFEKDAWLIYGTPNARSGPGLLKMGWLSLDRSSSSLTLVPRGLNPIVRKLGIKRNEIESVQAENPDSPIKGLTLCELSIEQYIEATEKFPRMNCVDNGYLKRRLQGRRFFCYSDQDGKFYCCIRKYKLNFLHLLLVSEYFLDGKIDVSAKKYHCLKKLCKRYYCHFDGFYLDNPLAAERPNWLSLMTKGFVRHRTLPIRYVCHDHKEDVKQMLSALSSDFQMSDCDIG